MGKRAVSWSSDWREVWHPHFLLGNTVTVDIPEIGHRSGKVVMCEGQNTYRLRCGRACYELGPGCLYLGIASRKTRIDTPGYLSGKVPTFHTPGQYPHLPPERPVVVRRRAVAQ